MTEEEWLAGKDPGELLKFLGQRASERKLRLFGVACCRRVWTLFVDSRSRLALEQAEHFADGRVDELVLQEAHVEAQEAALRWYPGADDVPDSVAYAASVAVDVSAQPHLTVSEVTGIARITQQAEDLAGEADPLNGQSGIRPIISEQSSLEAQAALVRCIFPNPFKATRFDRTWVSSTAESLGRQMYESRDFGAAGILADALEDMGCRDEELLGHLRGPGPHCRGCRGVDLVLGFE